MNGTLPIYTLKLSAQTVMAIGQALSELPYKSVAPHIGEILGQCDEQEKAATPLAGDKQE